VCLQLLSRFEFQVGGEQVIYVRFAFVGDIHTDEGKSTEPDHH
jgi:hypothetical protein